jgi:HD superfamily phosphodiesterase
MSPTEENNLMTASQSLRAQILEIVEHIFSSANQVHGLKHALEVEQLVLEIAQEPEFAGVPLDATVLSAAAVLHDSGYTRARPSWSSDRIEHVEESVCIAQEALATVAPFDTDADRLRQVCYLILYHDQTNYSFPIKTRDGKPAISAQFQKQFKWPYILPDEKKSIRAMLAILKEADALTATGAEGAKRTLKYSRSRGIPLFAAGNPLNAWMWEESAIGNVRLAAKRALLDAFTRRGKEIAWRGYLETEGFIRELAEENGVPYHQEIHLSDLHGIAYQPSDGVFHINRVHSWEQLVDSLRRLRLNGDVNLHPYREATIESRLVEIDSLSPLAYYALTSQLEVGNQLRQRFLTRYALDPFDLSGIVDLTSEGKECRIAPPLVEVYIEQQGPLKGKRVWALVDGLHRCLNAKHLGFSRVRAIVISTIPKDLPLVPLPLRWKDVRLVDKIPEEAEKRAFRFPNLKSFPDITSISSVPVTAQNCRYFFFRDLRPLGSSGIRKVASIEETQS